MNRNDLPKILFDKMRMVESYPKGVVPVPKMVDTTAFFPGGTGLWNNNIQSEFPTILVLGQDFSTLGVHKKIQAGTLEDTDCATWRNLLKVFEEAGVKLEDCFFSNVFMGLRKTASITGEFPGYTNDEFVDKNLKFLNFQIEVIKPMLIITLGKYAAEMLSRASSNDLVNWKDFNALRGGDIGFVKDVSFGNLKVDCVALEHPSMRALNMWRREYCDLESTSHEGHDAEIYMIKDALDRLERKKVEDEVNHINFMDARGRVYCKKHNSIVKLDFEVCFTCSMLSGSAQGEGVECLWKDKELKVPFFKIYNPKAEFERVNEKLMKPDDKYYTENEKAFGDLLYRISKVYLNRNDCEISKRRYIENMDKVELNKHSITLIKNELISKGFIIDESPQPIGEVNFLASKDGKTLKIKVRSITQIGGYIFIEKSKFDVVDQSLYMAVLYMPDNKKESVLYLIPAVDWTKNIYPLSGKDYNKPNQKSLPEWGISYSQKAKDAMEAYRFDKVSYENR